MSGLMSTSIVIIPIEQDHFTKTKEEISKRYENFYNKWRDYDLLTCILAMIGLTIGIIDVPFSY